MDKTPEIKSSFPVQFSEPDEYAHSDDVTSNDLKTVTHHMFAPMTHAVAMDTPSPITSQNGVIPSFLPVKPDWQIRSPMMSPSSQDYRQQVPVINVFVSISILMLINRIIRIIYSITSTNAILHQVKH